MFPKFLYLKAAIKIIFQDHLSFSFSSSVFWGERSESRDAILFFNIFVCGKCICFFHCPRVPRDPWWASRGFTEKKGKECHPKVPQLHWLFQSWVSYIFCNDTSKSKILMRWGAHGTKSFLNESHLICVSLGVLSMTSWGTTRITND